MLISKVTHTHRHTHIYICRLNYNEEALGRGRTWCNCNVPGQATMTSLLIGSKHAPPIVSCVLFQKWKVTHCPYIYIAFKPFKIFYILLYDNWKYVSNQKKFWKYVHYYYIDIDETEASWALLQYCTALHG